MSGERALAEAPGARREGQPGRVPRRAGEGASRRLGARARGCGGAERRVGGRTKLAPGPCPPGKRRRNGLRQPPGSNLHAVTAPCGLLVFQLTHSLTRAQLLLPFSRQSPAEPERGRASEQGREGAKEEGTRTRPGSPSALLPALPSATGPPRAPLTLGKLRTALRPRVAPRGAARASSGGGGGGGGGGRKGSEPQGSAPSCLSSCFCSHPEQHSHKGADPLVVGWRR